jgi:hypothetical protein
MSESAGDDREGKRPRLAAQYKHLLRSMDVEIRKALPTEMEFVTWLYGEQTWSAEEAAALALRVTHSTV